MSADETRLDLRGLNCPLPVLKAKKAMRSLKSGQRVLLETTDPLATIDIPAFCNEDGHKLIEVQELDGFNLFVLECG